MIFTRARVLLALLSPRKNGGRARVLLALLSPRKNGGLLVVYSAADVAIIKCTKD